jgi:endo-alpha-1,4-polygalactosaminidase (GH114 family)
MHQNVKELIERIEQLKKVKPRVVVAYCSNGEAMAEDEFDKLQWKEAVKK